MPCHRQYNPLHRCICRHGTRAPGHNGMTASERRRDSRTSVSLMGALQADGQEAAVVVMDLSATGARIQANDPPDLEREYELHFSVHHTAYSTRFRVTR